MFRPKEPYLGQKRPTDTFAKRPDSPWAKSVVAAADGLLLVLDGEDPDADELARMRLAKRLLRDMVRVCV